jgi:hypothetical protein
MRPNRIEIVLSDSELADLDEARPSGLPRATYLHQRLYEPPSTDKIATHEEVLGLLSRKAREGSVSAAVALERALRGTESDGDFDDELARFLRD